MTPARSSGPARRRPRRQPGGVPGGGRTPSRRRGAPERRGLGGEQVEGRRAVRELLAAGRRRVDEVWMSEGLDASPLLAEIVDLAAARRVPVRSVGRERLRAAAATEAPQGVLARAAPLPDADLGDLTRATGDRAPFLLALDGVTDPHNLGALLRSAECAGATGALLPRHRSVHVTPAVTKAAAGAVEYLPLAVVPGMPAALADLRRAGVWTVGLDAGAERSVFDLPLGAEPVALVLGAEGSGLSRLVRQRCDVLVGIPQRGSLSSLNVSAAGAIACFEVARRRAG